MAIAKQTGGVGLVWAPMLLQNASSVGSSGTGFLGLLLRVVTAPQQSICPGSKASGCTSGTNNMLVLRFPILVLCFVVLCSVTVHSVVLCCVVLCCVVLCCVVLCCVVLCCVVLCCVVLCCVVLCCVVLWLCFALLHFIAFYSPRKLSLETLEVCGGGGGHGFALGSYLPYLSGDVCGAPYDSMYAFIALPGVMFLPTIVGWYCNFRGQDVGDWT